MDLLSQLLKSVTFTDTQKPSDDQWASSIKSKLKLSPALSKNALTPVNSPIADESEEQHPEDLFYLPLTVYERRHDPLLKLKINHINRLYHITHLLGVGGYGKTFSATVRETGASVAIKFLNLTRLPASSFHLNSELGRVPFEIHALHTFSQDSHPNIIRFIETFTLDDYLVLVQEQFGHAWSVNPFSGTLNNGVRKKHVSMDLFEYLDTHRIDEETCRHIFKQVLSAIIFMFNEHGILHGDMKDENVLIDDQLHIKLIDFGAAVQIQRPGELRKASQFLGTLEFASPELVLGREYDPEKNDVWSLGLMLFGMLFGRLPFKNLKEVAHMDISSFSIPQGYIVSDTVVNLIRQCLRRNPNDRLTLKELSEHEWLH
jgi:serine/threonine protein kinase